MISFIRKYYLPLILFVLIVSMGQTLLMIPWQDDNALFFKLANINGDAGFLGPGLFGHRAYKYTAFFYYPIYLLFKFQPFYYFALGFVLYGFCVFVLYKVVNKIINKDIAILASFLYACGFVGSDSFIRLYNSVITSISIVLVLLFVFTYWNFYKKRKNMWYFVSVLVFFLAAEFARARTHYMIALPVFFEIIFLAFKKPLAKSITKSIFRISLFLPIFYRYVIWEDYRSGGIIDLLHSFFVGEFYKIYGFVSSFNNMLLPVGSMYSLGAVFLILATLAIIAIKFKKLRKLSLLFLGLSIIWGLIAFRIFINSALVVSLLQTSLAFAGGELILFFSFLIFVLNKKSRQLYLFLFLCVLVSIAAYWVYGPTLVYEKINRYLSHSFVFLTILFSFLYYSIKNKRLSNIVFLLIILWGFQNMIGAFLYQRNIIINRTQSVVSFYEQLKSHINKVDKGDVLYFDVADEAKSNFADAFSVAQMPDTTAIAWRYGVDRYDFEMFETPQDFFQYLKETDIDKNKIHTFFYSNSNLTDTTNDLLSCFESEKFINLDTKTLTSQQNNPQNKDGYKVELSSVQYDGEFSFPSMTPMKLIVEISGTPIDTDRPRYPLYYGPGTNTNEIFIENKARSDLAFEYKKYKQDFKDTKVDSSSDWQERVAQNLVDDDPSTIWQADRLLWLNSNQFVTLEFNKEEVFNRLVFINHNSDFTPLEFDIFGSLDKDSWKLIKTYQSDERLANGQSKTVSFSPVNIKYAKIVFKKTLNEDAPIVSEILFIPSRFDDLDTTKAALFLGNPFSYIPSQDVYRDFLQRVGYSGTVELSWWNNKTNGWQNSEASKIKVVFDGRTRLYEIPILPGGTQINKLRFLLPDFPAEIKIHSLGVFIPKL